MSPRTSTATKRAARAPLSRRRVLTAGLGHVDAHGLDELTMAKLADELGVGVMSLYNHVRNKDDLVAGIGDLLWGEIADALPTARNDAAWLRGLGHAIKDTLQHHPHAAPAIVGTNVFPPPMLAAIADQFDRHGTAEPDPRLVNGIGTVTAFVLGWACTGAVGLAPIVAHETERQRIRRVTKTLPPETPDRLADAAIAVCAVDIDAMFTHGLDAIITGCGFRTKR